MISPLQQMQSCDRRYQSSDWQAHVQSVDHSAIGGGYCRGLRHWFLFLHSFATEVLNLCPWPRLKHWFAGNTAINCGLPRNRSTWHQHSQMTWHSRSFIMGPRLLNTWNINKNAWRKAKCVRQCGGKHATVKQTGCKVIATFVYLLMTVRKSYILLHVLWNFYTVLLAWKSV